MQLHSNLPEFINNLQRIRDAVASGGAGGAGTDFSDALFAALNSGMGAMKNRIFNRSLDANGESLGKYIGKTTKVTKKKFRAIKYGRKEREKQKTVFRKNLSEDASAEQGYSEYEKIRLAHGRQIGRKDLEFLGSLRRTIETVKKDGKAQIVITNDKNALIASYQEQQIGNIRATGKGKGSAAKVPIFQLSKEEFDKVQEQGKLLIAEVIQKIVNNR